MAVFFTGAFTRELRREADRRLRRDTIEKAHAHLGLDPFVFEGHARRLFTGLGNRRLLSGRGKLGALSEPKSQAIGTPKNQYSTSGNQSRSSVGRGRNTSGSRTQGTQGTSGTSGRSRTSGTTGSGRTSGTVGTRPSFVATGSTRTGRTSTRSSRVANAVRIA